MPEQRAHRVAHHTEERRSTQLVAAGMAESLAHREALDLHQQVGPVVPQQLAQGFRDSLQGSRTALYDVGTGLGGCPGIGVEGDVARSDEPNVDRRRLAGADADHFAFLQDSEQLDLQRQWEVANLVQKERPAIRGLEPALASDDCPRERSGFVTEEFARCDVFADGSAVDRQNRSTATAELVDVAGDQLLAGTRFPEQQYTIRTLLARRASQREIERLTGRESRAIRRAVAQGTATCASWVERYRCMPQRRTVSRSMVWKTRLSTARPIRITAARPAKTLSV